MMEAAPAAEALNPLQAAGAALQRFGGRVAAGVRDAYETVSEMPRSVRLNMALGGTSIGLLLASAAPAEAVSFDHDPLKPDNAPVLGEATLPGAPETANPVVIHSTEAPQTKPDAQLAIHSATNAVAAGGNMSFGGFSSATLAGASGPEATAATAVSSQVQDCTDQELAQKPHMEKLDLTSPGTPSQTLNVSIKYDAAPEGCPGIVQRDFKYDVKLVTVMERNGKLHHVLTRLVRPADTMFTNDNVGYRGISTSPSGHNSRQLYCKSAGGFKTKLFLENIGTITDLSTGTTSGHTIVSRERVQVKGKTHRKC